MQQTESKCPKCSAPMIRQRRILMSLAFLFISVLALFITGPILFKIWQIAVSDPGISLSFSVGPLNIKGPRTGVNWAAAAPIVLVFLFALFLLYRANQYFSPHLSCTSCSKKIY